MVAARRSPFSVFRTASTVRAPAPANAPAVTSTNPLVAPVMITVRPVWSGRSFAVHFAIPARVVGAA